MSKVKNRNSLGFTEKKDPIGRKQVPVKKWKVQNNWTVLAGFACFGWFVRFAHHKAEIWLDRRGVTFVNGKQGSEHRHHFQKTMIRMLQKYRYSKIFYGWTRTGTCMWLLRDVLRETGVSRLLETEGATSGLGERKSVARRSSKTKRISKSTSSRTTWTAARNQTYLLTECTTSYAELHRDSGSAVWYGKTCWRFPGVVVILSVLVAHWWSDRQSLMER